MKFLWIGLGILSLLLVISVAGLYCLDNTADQVAGCWKPPGSKV